MQAIYFMNMRRDYVLAQHNCFLINSTISFIASVASGNMGANSG